MWYCRFIMMKNRRYKCDVASSAKSYDDQNLPHENMFLPMIKHVWINVMIKPPIGFCRRPHYYLHKAPISRDEYNIKYPKGVSYDEYVAEDKMLHNFYYSVTEDEYKAGIVADAEKNKERGWSNE